MPKAETKVKKVDEVKVFKKTGFYKGYDIRWLKSEPSHEDFYLVAELEAKLAKKK